MTEQRPSLLELVHPAGRAARSLVVGAACPAVLRPRAGVGGETEEELDLIVLAPDGSEGRTRDWLDAAAIAAKRLDEDGVVYVLAGLRARSRLLRRLSRSALIPTAAFVHTPDPSSTRHLVQLEADAVRYALENLVGRDRAGLRRLAAIALEPALRLPVQALPIPSLGVAFQRSDAPQPLEWLFRLDPPVVGGSAIVRRGWRGEQDAILVYRFGGEGRDALVKLPGLARNVGRESVALQQFGPQATRAGAEVPRILPDRQSAAGPQPFLAQTLIRGISAAAALIERPERFAELTARIGDWIVHWNRLSARTGALSVDRLEHELLKPARVITPHVEGGAGYLARLEARCAEWRDLPASTVAAHLDLTMANVLLSSDGRLGIVDWEAARPDSLPLVDLLYAVADAAAATTAYSDRVGAFRDCFLLGGRHAAHAGALVARLVATSGLDDRVSDLCFHACWLHHAVNEHRSSHLGGGTPFREIVATLAARGSLTLPQMLVR